MRIFVTADENLLCTRNTYKRFLSLTTIFNIKYARECFSSLTTEDKISIASDKNRAVCARLYTSHLTRINCMVDFRKGACYEGLMGMNAPCSQPKWNIQIVPFLVGVLNHHKKDLYMT